MWFLYNVLFTVAFVALLPHYLLRMRRRGGYRRNFLQRLGRYAPEVRDALRGERPVWIQAVSVGEVFVALQLMEKMRRPGIRFILSVNTSTGHRIAEQHVQPPDVLLYFPLDFPLVMRRALKAINPRMLILVECELWPNLLRLTAARGTPIALVNGRISAHSHRGYRKLRYYTRRLLKLPALLCVQSEVDRQRLLDLGAPQDILRVMGSAKYEVATRDPDGESRAQALLRQAGLAGRTLLLGGSTWSGEEALLLDLFGRLKQDFPNLALVLAPRHVERTDDVLREIEQRGLPMARRSLLGDAPPDPVPDVLLIDTTGELRHFYAGADIIFIGKSLTQHGGQNIIEPALYGKPVLCGPNMENFPVVMDDFLDAEAVWQIADARELEAAVRRLLGDPDLRAAYGSRADALVCAKAGALARTVRLLESLLHRSTP